MYYCIHVNTVLNLMHYSYELEYPMAKLNALSSVTCPCVLTWMHYGESDWCFYTFDCSMANLNAHYEFLAAVWWFWMTILHFWLPYGDFEWLVWIFGCPIAKLNELFILLHALVRNWTGKPIVSHLKMSFDTKLFVDHL